MVCDTNNDKYINNLLYISKVSERCVWKVEYVCIYHMVTIFSTILLVLGIYFMWA